MGNVLSNNEREMIDAYWRAANYLSVGQIYLYDNPLLKQTLTKDHIKPRLLGHWGTTPGLNFIYAHLNRQKPVAAGAIGFALTIATLNSLFRQVPAGAALDSMRDKRRAVLLGIAGVGLAALPLRVTAASRPFTWRFRCKAWPVR